MLLSLYIGISIYNYIVIKIDISTYSPICTCCYLSRVIDTCECNSAEVSVCI